MGLNFTGINVVIIVEKQINIRIFGKVQGVFFRQSTKDKAESLNIKGVVLNEADGSVYISAVGNEKDLDLFLIYCKIGPPAADVKNIVIEETEIQNFNGFSILR